MRSKKKEEYTVPFFIWALAFVSKQFVLLSFHVIVFVPPGVPIDCHISVRYMCYMSLIFDQKYRDIWTTHKKNLYIKETWWYLKTLRELRAKIKHAAPILLWWYSIVSTTKLLYLSSNLYCLPHCENHC